MTNDIKLGRFGKQGNVNLGTIKGGIKKEQFQTEIEKNIFDLADANKDGVLTNNEVEEFKKKVQIAAKNGNDTILSKSEAKKFLEHEGMKELKGKDLLNFLKNVQALSENSTVEQAYVDENGYSVLVSEGGAKTEVIRGKDKTSSMIYQNEDGQLIRNFDSDKKQVSEQFTDNEGNVSFKELDANGKVVKETITANGGSPVTTINYKNEEPASSTVVNGSTVEEYTYVDGKPRISSRIENKGLEAKEKKSTYTYNDDGTVTENTVEIGKNTETIRNGETVLRTTTKEGDKTTRKILQEDGSTLEVIDDGKGTITNNTINKDGHKTSQTIQVGDKTYQVQYDGQGNTPIVVQNGESPAIIAKKFGCTVEELIAANPGAIKGKAPNQYFLVGSDIVIPGEMNAEKFEKLNEGRQSKEQTVAEYAEYESTVADARLSTKQTKEITVEKNYANWTEYAKEMLKNEGIERPTTQQIVDRTNELTALNPDIQVPAKGSKITVTKTNEEISQEAEKQKQVNEAKQKQATKIANKFYQIADDNSGLNSMRKMQAMFDNKEINADNIVAVLDAYDDQGAKKGDSSMIDTITSETGAGGTKQQRQVLMSVLNTLCDAAKNAGVSQEDIAFAKSEFESSLNKEFDAVLRRTNPMEMENAINFLKGAILAKQNEVENVDTQQAMTEMAQGFKAENDNANTEFEEARKEEGWAAKTGDTICGWFGCNTIEDLRAKLGNNSKNVEALIQAAESKDETKFKEIYKQTFGVEFDANKIAAREKASDKLMQATGTKAALELFSGIDSNMSYNDIVAKLSESYDQETIEQIISGYSKGYRMPASSDSEKKAILLKYVETSTVKLKSDYQQLTNGKTLEQMKTDLDTLTKSAYGTNDIGKAVAQFNENQQTTEMITEVAAEIAVTAALMAVPGGQAFAAAKLAASAARWGSKGIKVAKYANKALKMAKTMQKVQKGKVIKNSTSISSKIINKSATAGFNMAATGTATLGVDLSNGKSVNEAVKKALMNMSFAGVGTGSSQLAPKLMQTFKVNSSLANEIAEEIINAAGSYGITKLDGADYASTDAFVDIASGIILSRLSHVKSGSKPEATHVVQNDPQQVSVSKGVKGDVNNHRDAIADGTAARNTDRSHLNADERKMVEQGLEDVSTEAELETMKKASVETVSNNAAVETPEVKPAAEVKSDITPESVKESVKNISDAEIPVEHKNLWKDCRGRIDKITDELKHFKGDTNAFLLKCENLFKDLQIIANKSTTTVKNKINQIIENLRSMLTPKNLPDFDGALTPQITSRHKMEMGQIGNSIQQSKNLDDLNKLQTWLDQMPECEQKAHLQKQLNAKYTELPSSHVNTTPTADFSNQPTGTHLPKKQPVTLTGTENLKLANFDLDLSSPEIQSKLKAMKNGDVITVGRNVSGPNDIKIDDNFRTVSGKHLEIKKVGDKFVITDLSLNGTTLAKSLASVSDEIKTTFGHQTVNNIADLKPGEVKSIVKGDIEYKIENVNGNIEISSKRQLKPSLNPAIKFDKIKMSDRTPAGEVNPGKTMGELLTLQQKKVYSDSMDAFENSKNKKITHNANNILTTDNLLHGTDINALLSNGGILDNGLVPREISGKSAAKFADGSVPNTLTPLCSDVWDIRQDLSIKDYFDANNQHWNNNGESNFLPNSNQMASPIVIVFDKKSMDPTLIDNSFGVNNSGRSVLFENGNMSRGHNYPTHRAIPIGAPANSIDRIIIDTRRLGKSEIKSIQKKVKSLGLDIKLYDLNGRLLS